MFDLRKLRDDHFRLMGTLRRLSAAIECRKPPPPVHLLALRHELSSMLIRHWKFADWMIYAALLNNPDKQVAETARHFAEEMGGVAQKYRAHCEKWTANAIAVDWRGYCIECREMLDALASRITRESREFYPLLGTATRAA